MRTLYSQVEQAILKIWKSIKRRNVRAQISKDYVRKDVIRKGKHKFIENASKDVFEIAFHWNKMALEKKNIQIRIGEYIVRAPVKRSIAQVVYIDNNKDNVMWSSY